MISIRQSEIQDRRQFLDQILEQQMIEADSIVANPVRPVGTSPVETNQRNPHETSPVKSELTYHTTDYSDGIQAVITRKSRKRVPMENFTNDPEVSLSATCPHDIETEPKNTSLI